jgi:hypothetical protein
MSNNPLFWSSVGFWILVAGLVSEGLVILFVSSLRLEKIFSVLCTIVIIAGVSIEHRADAKRFAPRTLSPEQQDRLISKLMAASGQKFSLTAVGEPEALNLLKIVESVLLASGWVRVPTQAFGDIQIGDASLAYGTGLIAQLSPNATLETQNRASAVASAFNDEDIASKPEADARVTDTALINILVGKKP